MTIVLESISVDPSNARVDHSSEKTGASNNKTFHIKTTHLSTMQTFLSGAYVFQGPIHWTDAFPPFCEYHHFTISHKEPCVVISKKECIILYQQLIPLVSSANWVVRCEATQFSVAATNHIALSSDQMRSIKVRLDERCECSLKFARDNLNVETVYQ